MGEPRLASSVSELLAMVDAEWQRLLQAIDGVGEDRLEEPLLPARDVLSHVRLFDAWLLGMLRPPDREDQELYRSFLTPPGALHERNRIHLECDHRLAPDGARRRAMGTHATLCDVLADLPDDRPSVLHTVNGDGLLAGPRGRPLAWLIAVETPLALLGPYGGSDHMTCAPDAFHNYMGLQVLEPGQRVSASWGLAVRSGPARS